LAREGDGRLSILGQQADAYNLRIDYFVIGVKPTLQIKATHSITNQQV
jgi:hypothetical protein